MARVRLNLLAAALAFYVSGRSVSAINVSLPISAPGGSQGLSPTLLSFSIEQDRWPDWTGTDERNEFTHSALLPAAMLLMASRFSRRMRPAECELRGGNAVSRWPHFAASACEERHSG
ncbi:hypothetical protein NUW54_g4712 [Trametes sanguinea]|uniref:Uncharacterized protein n=1 Tax=Trametes sanguinea TaxID=158606 RepID=A0ACC1PZA0_9APHY|nr:hypothetical protein NUW54_g4712 [Trametes sanguinea]